MIEDPNKSPVELLNEQVAATEAKLRDALAEVERLKAESIRRGRLLLKFRDELLGIAERIDATEDDRSYFGSTNDADRLKEVAESLDAFKWDLIMAEKSQPCIFETNKKNIARATAAESALAATKAKLDAAEKALLTAGEFIMALRKTISEGGEVSDDAMLNAAFACRDAALANKE